MAGLALLSLAELMRKPEDNRWIADSTLACDWPNRRRELVDTDRVLILKADTIDRKTD